MSQLEAKKKKKSDGAENWDISNAVSLIITTTSVFLKDIGTNKPFFFFFFFRLINENDGRIQKDDS